MNIKETDYYTFIIALNNAQSNSVLVKKATTPCTDIIKSSTAKYYLTNTGTGGFIVDKGELTSLFSTIKGRGSKLLFNAIEQGANRLDCFAGYLTSFYNKHGFIIDRIEDNWTPGEPDIHYMVLLKALQVQAV